MKLGMKHSIICLAAFWLLFFPVSTNAGPKMKIEPLLKASWRLDTNYWRAENNERAVYTYLFRPGIDFGVETAKSSLLLYYTMDIHFYDDQDPVPPGQLQANELDFVGHTFSLVGQTEPTDRWLLGFDESYLLTRDPAQSDSVDNTVFRFKYGINRFTALGYYDLTRRFTLGLRYRNTYIDYTQDIIPDSVENRGLFDLAYNFSRDSSLALDYQLWRKRYEGETSDYTSNQLSLVYRLKAKRYSFGAGAGGQNRTFDDETLEDISTFIFNVNLNYDTTVDERPSFLSIDAYQNFNDQGIGNLYYRATRFTLAAGHNISKKLSGSFQGYYQLSDYDGTFGINRDGNLEERQDQTYDLSLTFAYALARWLDLSLLGGINNRNSNLAGFNYDNNYVKLMLTFAYDLGREKQKY